MENMLYTIQVTKIQLFISKVPLSNWLHSKHHWEVSQLKQQIRSVLLSWGSRNWLWSSEMKHRRQRAGHNYKKTTKGRVHWLKWRNIISFLQIQPQSGQKEAISEKIKTGPEVVRRHATKSDRNISRRLVWEQSIMLGTDKIQPSTQVTPLLPFRMVL